MVSVKGTKGNIVKFEIAGIAETVRMLKATGKKIERGADFGVVRAGTFVTEEVKESVAGRRAELRSVLTGEFLESVDSKNTKNTATIFSPVKQSVFMEFGTSRIPERRHFRNTLNRQKKNIQNILNNAIS